MLRSYARFRAREGGETVPDGFGEEVDAEVYPIHVVGMFESRDEELLLDPSANGIAPALIEHGLIPLAPWRPGLAFTLQVLDVYRTAHARCPQLTIYAFTRTLSDLHKKPHRPYLFQQFSIAYDLYLDLRRRCECLVLQMLGRNNSTWRIANVCPACTYKLKHEPSLKFSMFVAMDGNDSLKRVLRKEAVDVDHTVWAATERDDDRDASDGYYASRDKVDGFGKEKAGTLLPTDNVEDNPCATRWKNMINDTTAKFAVVV
ncbi:hypothetical protein MKEN_00443100 [Mycena kentingensis (nom. inval.)]|nr:hypothetical protein MKEN_00443100 [Mycena kentingensis (nom. inval.)]